jgi:hypothetical protein
MELFKLFGTIGIKNEEANEAIDETTEKAEGSEGRMSSAFKKIGAAIAAAFAIDRIVAFGKEIVNVAAEVDAEVSAFEQIMGDYTDEAKAKMGEIADATGMVDTRLTPYMTSMTAKFKGLGFGIEDATDLASEGLTIAADAAAFWDKSLDESMSHLNSFVNGSYEGGEAIGLFANDTQMAAYAVKTGVVDSTKAWSSLDEATKQATRLDYAKNMMEQSGATGQAAKEAGQYANVQANLNEKWRQFKAQIGEPLLQNVVIPAMEKLSTVVDLLSAGFTKLQNWTSKHQTTVSILAAVIGGAVAAFTAYKAVMLGMFIVQKVTTWLNGMTVAQRLLNIAMSMNPIGLVIAAIAALVAAFVILWNRSEGFRNFWIGLWNAITTKVQAVLATIKIIFENIRSTIQQKFDAIRTKVNTVVSAIKTYLSFSGLIGKVQSTFNSIKEKITSPIESAKSKVNGIISKIKGMFPLSIGKIFSNLKLPHFSVSGSAPFGIGGKGSPPKISVNWYAKAVDNPYLFSSPTVFGAGLSGIKVAGESDPEIMYGKSNLMRDIRNATAENATNNDHVEALLSTIVDWISSPTGFKRTMVDILTNDVKFMLDDRQVAKVVKAYVG